MNDPEQPDRHNDIWGALRQWHPDHRKNPADEELRPIERQVTMPEAQQWADTVLEAVLGNRGKENESTHERDEQRPAIRENTRAAQRQLLINFRLSPQYEYVMSKTKYDQSNFFFLIVEEFGLTCIRRLDPAKYMLETFINKALRDPQLLQMKTEQDFLLEEAQGESDTAPQKPKAKPQSDFLSIVVGKDPNTGKKKFVIVALGLIKKGSVDRAALAAQFDETAQALFTFIKENKDGLATYCEMAGLAGDFPVDIDCLAPDLLNRHVITAIDVKPRYYQYDNRYSFRKIPFTQSELHKIAELLHRKPA